MKMLEKIGNLLLLGLKLQTYFLIRTLRGGIILGIFPAFFDLFRIIGDCAKQQNADTFSLSQGFKRFERNDFRQTNLLGFLFLGICYILSLNLWVSRHYFPSGLFRIFTWALLAAVVSIALYVVPLYLKYELPLNQYIHQAFLCGVVGIFETVAIALGTGLALGLALRVPFIGLAMGIPLLILPHAWFSRAAVERFEKRLLNI